MAPLSNRPCKKISLSTFCRSCHFYQGSAIFQKILQNWKFRLRAASKLKQNTARWFQVSFRRVLEVLVTWWCFIIFLWFFEGFLDYKNKKHHQVTSTPKTLRKIAWNNLKKFWLNLEKNRWCFFIRSKSYLWLSSTILCRKLKKWVVVLGRFFFEIKSGRNSEFPIF